MCERGGVPCRKGRHPVDYSTFTEGVEKHLTQHCFMLLFFLLFYFFFYFNFLSFFSSTYTRTREYQENLELLSRTVNLRETSTDFQKKVERIYSVLFIASCNMYVCARICVCVYQQERTNVYVHMLLYIQVTHVSEITHLSIRP